MSVIISPHASHCNMLSFAAIQYLARSFRDNYARKNNNVVTLFFAITKNEGVYRVANTRWVSRKYFGAEEKKKQTRIGANKKIPNFPPFFFVGWGVVVVENKNVPFMVFLKKHIFFIFATGVRKQTKKSTNAHKAPPARLTRHNNIFTTYFI